MRRRLDADSLAGNPCVYTYQMSSPDVGESFGRPPQLSSVVTYVYPKCSTCVHTLSFVLGSGMLVCCLSKSLNLLLMLSLTRGTLSCCFSDVCAPHMSLMSVNLSHVHTGVSACPFRAVAKREVRRWQ